MAETHLSARGGGYAKGAAKREEILAGVMALFAREGNRRQSLRAIARSIGLEPAHILYYFPSREDLLQRVIERWDDDPQIVSAHPPESEPGLDMFVAAIRRNLAIPGIVHLYLSFAAEAVDPDHVAHIFFRARFARLRRNLSEAIGREQAAGTIAAHVDAKLAARHLIALADGLQLQSLTGTPMNAADDLEAAIQALRGG